jgi:flagellar biosynthesis protein FliQ
VPTGEHTGPPPGAPVVPQFEIVPRVGVAIAVVILALLVGAIASNSLWALDFFHVAGGGLWTGIDLFVGLAIGPILGMMSVQARIEFSTRFMPKMLVIMPTLVIVTLAAGYQLARHLGNLAPDYPHHGWLVASYIVVGVMAVIALGLLEPANLAVLFELKKERPDGERIGRLMRVFVLTAGITGVMQIATLVIMSRLATA